MAISGLRLLQELRNVIARARDAMTNSLKHVGFVEHEIDAGKSFTVGFENVSVLSSSSSSSGATIVEGTFGNKTAIGFVTPAAASGLIHMTVDAWANRESIFEIREDPYIVLNEGTVTAPFNRFRDSANTSGMLANETLATPDNVSTYTEGQIDAANLSGGDILHHETLAVGDVAPFESALNTKPWEERKFILKASTEYVAILTASTANDTFHKLRLNWNEHVSNG